MSSLLKYTVYDAASGAISCVLGVPDAAMAELQLQPGQALIAGAHDAERVYIVDGAPRKFPPAPSEHHRWDWATHSHIDPRSLDERRAQCWARIKAAREAAIDAPILDTPLGPIDVDAKGLERIQQTLVSLAAARELGLAPATLDWTMADNRVVSVEPTFLASVAVMLLARGTAAHATSRVLRAQIFDPATTAEQLDAIAWPDAA